MLAIYYILIRERPDLKVARKMGCFNQDLQGLVGNPLWKLQDYLSPPLPHSSTFRIRITKRVSNLTTVSFLFRRKKVPFNVPFYEWTKTSNFYIKKRREDTIIAKMYILHISWSKNCLSWTVLFSSHVIVLLTSVSQGQHFNRKQTREMDYFVRPLFFSSRIFPASYATD